MVEKTSVVSSLENDVADILKWLFGAMAKHRFLDNVTSGQRLGQAFMNVLRGADPNEYERLTGSMWDPFYADDKLPAALDKLTSK